MFVGAYVLCVEWARASIQTQPHLAIAALVMAGAALGIVALGTPADRLGLGTSKFGLRIVGGLALGAVLLLPAAVPGRRLEVDRCGAAVAAVHA